MQKCHTHKSGKESTGTKIKNVLGGQGRGESDILKNHAESSQEKLVVKTCGKKIKIKGKIYGNLYRNCKYRRRLIIIPTDIEILKGDDE